MTTARILALPIALAALGALASACGGPAKGGEDEAGGGTPYTNVRAAPDFALETFDGDTVRLADFADKKAILLNFWASWCPPCKAEIPDLIALQDEYGDDGFTVIGVTVNDLPRDSREFAKEMKIDYPTVIGTPKMIEDYDLQPWLPISIIVKDGKIVREWIGPRTKKEFEYAVKVALGKAPELYDVIKRPSASTGDRGGR